MNNCLVLLTNYYPFYKGEEYLESEIKYLSSNFKKIFIISTMVSNEMKQTRLVPENVVVLPIGIRHSKMGKVKMFINQFVNINKNIEKKEMIKEDSKNKILNKLYCYYFESRAMNIYEKIKNLLDQYDFNQYTSITIYSYWLYITSRVGVELKNKYFKDKNTKIISRAHRYDLYEYAAPLKYLPQRDFLLKSIDKIYPCSKDGVDILNRTYPKYKDKIEVRRLGTINNNIVSKITNEKLYIISCSAVRKVKRIDLIIEALNELERNNIEYKWTHIGDGPEFNNIKKLASKLLDVNNIEFTGFMKNKDVLKWYENNKVSVFINVSSSEGVPVSIMEACSMSIPVIATDVGGTREIVESGKNGYLLSKDCNVSDIVEKLIYISSMDIKSFEKLSKNSYNIWVNKSDAQKLYSDFSIEISR